MAGKYDVVVVGAGSAGCALAHRLSSEPGVSVALLEAGGSDEREVIQTPGRYMELWGSDVDWQYETTPQARTAGRVHTQPRGKVLGGTSSINGMVYLRGQQTDYDGWAASGCEGWGWSDVRRAFEELEAILQPAVLNPLNPLSEAMVEASVQAGFARNAGFDSGLIDGAGWNKSTIRNGVRNSTYRAFIAPVLDRPNLHVLPETRAVRLALDGKRVRGVIVQRADGGVEEIAAGEVIVSAGAYDSPRLLMLSGIGPAAELARHGIAPVADLPVGENLIDHLLIGIVYNSHQPISDLNAYCTEGCCFARSTPERAGCDIQINFAKEPHFAPELHDGVPRFTIIPGITKPKSRGTVRLTGSDPDAPLAIDPNYFDHPDDMRAMIAAVRLSRKIADQGALDGWNAGEHYPGPEIESDEAIAAYVAEGVSTWWHPVGTCRMGIGDDAVVDPRLRVRGIDGLRVADASVMPDIVGVNTNPASIMIGWRAGGLALA